MDLLQDICQGRTTQVRHADTMHPVDAEPGPSRSTALSSEIAITLSPDGDVASRIEAISATVAFVVENSGPALRDSIQPLGNKPYDAERQEPLVQRLETTADEIQNMVRSVLDGVEQDPDQLVAVADAYSDELTRDADHVVAVGEEHGYSYDVAKRSVRLATLAMAAGIRMGYDRDKVRDLGACGIVQDWGMYCLADRLRDPNEPYSVDDWLYFMKHPAYAVDALDQIPGLQDVVRIVAHQVHEQADGTGYPAGLRNERIHPFARIINVVDTYLFLTATYRGRPAYYPYDAMVYLLHQTSRGRFDQAATRAFVESLTIFPIGSHVQLSDFTEAKVIRQNDGRHTEPIVQRLSSDAEGRETPIDLTSSELKIIAPLPTPNRKEMRLEKEDLKQIIWQGPDRG